MMKMRGDLDEAAAEKRYERDDRDDRDDMRGSRGGSRKVMTGVMVEKNERRKKETRETQERCVEIEMT